MIDKQIINEMIEEIGFDVQQCGYLEIIKDAPNYPEIGGTFTDFECNLYSRECRFIERCRYKQLLCKEKKYEELKQQLDQLKQTLDEIEEFCIVYSDNHNAYENVYKHILEIINEAKDGEQ